MQESVKRKRAVNLSIDAGLVAEAKAAGVNLSATLEQALVDVLKKYRAETWLEENREALASVDAYIEANGLPLEKLRPW